MSDFPTYESYAATLQLKIHDLEEELAGLRQQLEDQRDLVEWMKHALSEQAWHWTHVVESLSQQHRHDIKRIRRESTETAYDHGDVEVEQS